MNPSAPSETATLAGGCFWCLEAVFREVEGVENVVSGYAGGASVNPTYEEVSTGDTGHAEAVRVTFEPDKISYQDLLEIFFSIHDPTTLNRQGADAGTQYRSAIYYNNDQQKAVAEQLISELNKARLWKKPIVTQLAPLGRFYSAEEHHQKYFSQHSHQPYCQLVISPKLHKFRKQWAKRLRGRTTS